MIKELNWLKGGILLGIVFLAAVWLIKPIGVSTQFVITDGIVWNIFSPELINKSTNGYSSTNAYLNKSGGKYASSIAHPINYGLLFVLSMVFGGFLSGKLSRNKISDNEKLFPKVWENRFGISPLKRFVYAFVAGFFVLFGARLAGGCTSGHMMSGMMQTSLSGYLFAAGAFATAIPFSILFFKSKNE